MPKLTVPSVVGATPRRRLFGLLDDAAARHRAIWIQGPPGAGKTTLAATYAGASSRTTLWYRFDETDFDPAVFFGNFRLAARNGFRRRTALPVFGPEYLGGLTAFARMFFRACLPVRTTDKQTLIVLDDCHVLSDQDAVAALLTVLCEEASPATLCLFMSRDGPPTAFANLLARGDLFVPAAEVLHFDMAETALLAQQCGGVTDSARFAKAHAMTGGWAAALVMLLRHGELSPATLRSIDNLAAEAWRRLPGAAQRHLLMTSVLEVISPASAAALTGDSAAPATFRRLAADHYLVAQTELPAPVWRVHSLWRSYLLTCAREHLGEAGMAGLQAHAARQVRDEGRFDEAAALFIQAGEWAGLRELITGVAGTCLAQGRHLQLREWLAALPDSERDTPWMHYWEGLALMPVDPKAALVCLGHAHQAFGEDPVGRMLSAAGALSAIMFAWDDFSAGPRWLAELERLESFREQLANPEIDAMVIVSANAPLLFDLGHPLLARWAQQAERVLPLAPPALQTMIASFLVNYYVWRGELAACRVLLHSLRDEYPNSGPLFAVTRHVWSAVIGFLSADHDAAGTAVEAARVLCVQYGLTFYLPQVYGQESYTALSLGDLPRAARAIDAMAAAILPGRRLDVAFMHHVRSGLLLARGEYAEARREAELAVSLSEECATPTNAHLVMICLAQVLIRQGEWDEADRWLDRAERFCIEIDAPLVRYVAQMTRVDCLSSRGDVEAAAAVLTEALPVARRNDWYNVHPFWQPEPIARLCALALARGIESDYVRRLIARRRLRPPPDADECWPWPVRIRALGPLEVEVNDARLDFPVRSQGKPLELLRCLIAHGGEHVPLTSLAESLWPDADGDRALAAMKTTLQRLRHLLGHDALIQREGRLGLNPCEVWLDAWVFERLLRECRGGADSAPLERALALYRGMLLADAAGDECSIPTRKRVHAAYLAGIEQLCSGLIESGREHVAMLWYRAAIAVDPLSDLLNRRHLELCLRLGYQRDAVQAYRDYERQLRAQLDVAPSPQLVALITASLQAPPPDPDPA